MPLIGPANSPVSQVIFPVIRSGSDPVSSVVLPLHRDCLVNSLVDHLHTLRSSKATDTGLRHSQTFSCSRAASSQGINLKPAPLKKSPALLASAWLISRHESCQRSASALPDLLLLLYLMFSQQPIHRHVSNRLCPKLALHHIASLGLGKLLLDVHSHCNS